MPHIRDDGAPAPTAQPPEEAPESWGRRDEWLRRVREQRQREGPFGTGMGRGGAARPDAGHWSRLAMPAIGLVAACVAFMFELRRWQTSSAESGADS